MVRIHPAQPFCIVSLKEANTESDSDFYKVYIGVSPSGKATDSDSVIPKVRILSPQPSKGYKKDVAPETPDFIGGFAVSTAEKTASDFVDVKKILFPF